MPNQCPHKSLHIDVYRSFYFIITKKKKKKEIGSNQVVLQYVNGYMKWWPIQTMECHWVLKRNELSSDEKIRSLKCILLREANLKRQHTEGS